MSDYFVESHIKALDGGPVEAHLQTGIVRRCFCRAHMHSAIELLIVKNGSFEIYANDRRYIANEGDLVLIRSNTIHHTYSLCDNASYYVIRMRPSLLAELSNGEKDSRLLLFFTVDKPDTPCFFQKSQTSGTALGQAISKFCDEFENDSVAKSIGITLASANILLGILRCSENTQIDITDSKATCIYNTIVFINKNYSRFITAADCAAVAGMSYSYFSRTFKAVIGKNFKEYLNETRVNHAEKLLCSSDKTVTEVALLCGFDNVSYFISVYKSLKGQTPHRSQKSNIVSNTGNI